MFNNSPLINARNISATSIHNVLDLNIDKSTFEGELFGGDYTQIQCMAEDIIIEDETREVARCNQIDIKKTEDIDLKHGSIASDLSNYVEGVQRVQLNARSHTAITHNETTKTWYGKKKTVIETSTVIKESLGDAIHTSSADGTVVRQNESMHLHNDEDTLRQRGRQQPQI